MKIWKPWNILIFSYSIGYCFFFVYYLYEIVSPQPLGDYIGSFGCTTYDVILNSVVGFVQSQSFFMALYRYLCIIHCDFFDGHEISGKVSFYIINGLLDP